MGGRAGYTFVRVVAGQILVWSRPHKCVPGNLGERIGERGALKSAYRIDRAGRCQAGEGDGWLTATRW